jgi:flagellar motor switch protein FliG
MLNNESQISCGKSFRRRKQDIHPLQTLDERQIEAEKGFTGKQKAAMLLASLDSATAAKLIKGVNPKAVHELAEELRQLDAAGLSSEKQGLEFAQQFCNSLQPKQDFQISDFFKEVMKKSVGVEQTEQIQSDIQEFLVKNDPFESIYSADPETIAATLANEHPQTAADVLSKIPKERVSEVLDLLDWGIRISIASRMYDCEVLGVETKERTAEVICKRPDANAPADISNSLSSKSTQSVRKLSVSLRNLGKEIRDGLLGIIRIKDKQAGRMVADLMIFWEDILQISNRSLQKSLRRIDIKKLALALIKADDRIVQKIQSNIAKPMAAVLNEQMLLFSAYKRTDIEQAREEIVDVLREMNAKGELLFIEE